MENGFKRFAAGLVVAGMRLAPQREARGSGFQVRENSARALGNAFAGAAASAENSNIIANIPAGIPACREIRDRATST